MPPWYCASIGQIGWDLDTQRFTDDRDQPQDALVKITAYDYAIYGGLAGKVTTISPDTIRDEVKPEIVYYRVFVRTDSDVLRNKAGTEFPIVPGMVTTADIRTGHKTVWDYLTKPLNKAREAMRER